MENIFGLENSDDKPGLYLTDLEFKEMVKDTVVEKVDGLVWNLCTRHIGIAYHVIGYLCAQFKNKRNEEVSQADLESAVRSAELLDYISSYCRGTPSLRAFQKVIRGYEVEEVIRVKMENILESVSSGKVVFSNSEDRSPGSNEAVDLLTRVGFLYEDQKHQLHFASSMHLKCWLQSCRKDPLIHLLKNTGLEDFVKASIGRMSASRLFAIAGENDDIVRERQFQMELYHSLVSCVPKSYLITPEWRTKEKDGYVDLVIRDGEFIWFLELLVDGDDAIGHEKRFKPNETYHSSFLPNSRHVLIDFRQKRASIRKFRSNFIYVEFDTAFRKACLTFENKSTVDVDLDS